MHTSTRVVTRPPTGHGITFDPGAFSGEIVVQGAQWVESLVGGKVIGQITYTGGMGCKVLRYLQLDGTMYDEAGRIADTGFDNRTQVSTGSTYPSKLTSRRTFSRDQFVLSLPRRVARRSLLGEPLLDVEQHKNTGDNGDI